VRLSRRWGTRLGGFELLEEFGGVVAENGEGLGVLSGVDHVVSPWR